MLLKIALGSDPWPAHMLEYDINQKKKKKKKNHTHSQEIKKIHFSDGYTLVLLCLLEYKNVFRSFRMHKNTISGLFPSLLAKEGRVSLVVCSVTQSVPFIYMHNIHKPCLDMIIIIIKKGKEKEEKKQI